MTAADEQNKQPIAEGVRLTDARSASCALCGVRFDDDGQYPIVRASGTYCSRCWAYAPQLIN
jgi:hypothetical protein